MKSKVYGAVAAATFFSATLSGCNTYNPPSEVPPNGTIEQVAHNLGYEQTLAGLALHQQITVDLFQGKDNELSIYNYTTTKINQMKVAKVARSLTRLGTAAKPATRDIVVHPAEGKPIEIKTQDSTWQSEHDVLIVPEDTALPDLFTHNYLELANTAITKNFLAGQKISVVQQQPNENDEPGDILAYSGLATELCQSELEVSVTAYGLEGYTSSDSETTPTTLEIDHLAQETVCNGLGDAIQNIAQGNGYDSYQLMENYNDGTVPSSGSLVELSPYTLSQSQYKTLQTELK